jgi:hypothetical protein
MTTIAAVIYRAPHLRQMVSSDPYGKYNCTAYAAARAIRASTLGGMAVSGKLIRQMSSEPIPNRSSPGLNIRQVVDVSVKLRVPLYSRIGQGWDYVIDVLDTNGPGRRIVAQIDHDAWGEKCQAGSSFLHALTLDALRRKDGRMQILGSDPLCGALQWYYANNVRDAMAAFTGNVNSLSFAVTREIPLIAQIS